MPHAAFYVLGRKSWLPSSGLCCFNAARSILCIGIHLQKRSLITVCFNAARSILCIGTCWVLTRFSPSKFQCRTQHSMYWDSVVPSPCPIRAEKPFWKVVRFSRCFCCQNALSERKIAWQIASIPCAARAAPFWKIITVECGLRAPMDHFPLFAPITIIA